MDQSQILVYPLIPYPERRRRAFWFLPRSWPILLSRTLSGVEGHPGSFPDLGPSSNPINPGSKKTQEQPFVLCLVSIILCLKTKRES